MFLSLVLVKRSWDSIPVTTCQDKHILTQLAAAESLCYLQHGMPVSSKAAERVNAATTLNARKRQFIRNQIWDTAIDLFAEQGFDKTTVEDIARAAGVSQRTFFRYFSSRSDLMAQTVLNYGTAVAKVINSCPRGYTLSEVLRETVLQVARQAAEQPRTRKIIEISAKYAAAREAQLSRIAEVQETVASVYARRCKDLRRGDPTPKILAQLTLAMTDVALQCWFEDGGQDISASVEQAFRTLGSIARG